MARRHANTTKLEIIQKATEHFLEKGYSATPPKLICDELDISTGNLTYYFPTKEHLLAVLVQMLCDFQGKLMQEMVEEEGATSLMALCLELATMTAANDSDPAIHDFFISAYSSRMCLKLIRKSDCARAKVIFSEFCPNWTDTQYAEAESLVSGIEFATLMTTSDSAPLEMRITGALNYILAIYNVPENIRKTKIQKVLAMDYRRLGQQVMEHFKQFVIQTNTETIEAILSKP